MGTLDGARQRLEAAAHAYDEATVHAILDEVLAGFSLETVLQQLTLPVLREIGAEWERGTLEVGQEHFASCSCSLAQARSRRSAAICTSTGSTATW